MKEEVMNRQKNNALRSFSHAFAPIVVLIITGLIMYAAVRYVLPEALQPYEAGFEILAVLSLLFFFVVTIPCIAYSIFLALRAMIRDRKFVLPLIALILDTGLAVVWVKVLQVFLIK